MLGLKLNPRHPILFFILYFGAVAGVIVVFNILLDVIRLRTDMTQEWQKERLRASLDFVGTVSPEKPLALMLGTSEMQTGFDPLEFDRLLASSRGRQSYTLNMAVDNLGKWTPLYLARLIYELKARGLRPKMILLHIPGIWLTAKARRFNRYEAKFFDFPPVLYNRDLLLNFPAEREERVMAAFNKWLLGERSLLQLPLFFKTIVPQKNETVSARAHLRLWFRPEFHTYPAWDPAVQGRFYFNMAEHPRAVARLIQLAQSEEGVAETVDKHNRCCDFLNYKMDDSYMVEIAAAVRSLRQVSDHIVIVESPENPYFKRSAESRSRYQTALQTIARASEAELWSAAEEVEFVPEDFIDISHLSPTGSKKFSDFLASRVPEAWLPQN